MDSVKRSLKQAIALRSRGRRVVRATTVVIAALAATSSAGLAWAASATATGRAHHPRTTHDRRPSTRTGATRDRHQPGRDQLPAPAPPASLTGPTQAAVPTTDPYAYNPPPPVYAPPVASSGGS